MSVATYNFNNADSGYVQLAGIFYSSATGYANVAVAKNPATGTIKRGVMRFDTSGIGSTATISLVEFKYEAALAQPSPQTTNVGVRIGSWCGATLDASANDYNATGSLDTAVNVFDNAEGSFFDLDSGLGDGSVLGYINQTGITDVQLRDADGTKTATGYNFNDSKQKCQLRVTYTVPPPSLVARTMMGVGLCLLGWLGINWNPFLKTKVFNPL